MYQIGDFRLHLAIVQISIVEIVYSQLKVKFL